MKKVVVFILTLLLVVNILPIHSFAADSSSSFEVGTGIYVGISNATIVSTEDASVPDEYGEDNYNWDRYAKNVLLTSVGANDTIEVEISFNREEEDPLSSLGRNWGTFPKVSTIGYTVDEIDLDANEDPDPENEFWQSDVCIPYTKLKNILTDCEGHVTESNTYKYSVELSDGKAQLVLFYYDTHEVWTKQDEDTMTPDPLILNFLTENAANEAVSLIDISASAGQFENINHVLSGVKESYLVVPKSCDSVDVTMKFNASDISATVKVDNGTESSAVQASADGIITLSLTPAAMLYSGLSSASTNRITIYDSSNKAVDSYTLKVINQRFDDLPNKVVDYLCIGSQYTNGEGTTDYGLRPVRSLVGSNRTAGGVGTGPVSLGNFGGYITYYYDTPITDDPNNPYGIDFITFGNSYRGSQEFGEPGQVWVSDNGTDWYALAGAMHYEDYATWDYYVTYSNNNGFTTGTDPSGNVKELAHGSTNNVKYQYPDAIKYPHHIFSDKNKESITLTGICFEQESQSDNSTQTEARYAHFGYTDVGSSGTKLFGENERYWDEDNFTEETYSLLARNIAKNPYITDYSGYSNGSYDRYNVPTDGMDLAWAVDENGQPVEFPHGIHYIKIATASYIINSSLGEKSTEVNMVRVAQASDAPVKVSVAPASISFDGNKVDLTKGTAVGERNNVFTFDGENKVVVDGEFEVKVVAEDSHVYINNNPKASVEYDTIPDHGIIRVIVQDGEKEPLIYVFNLREMTEDEKAAKAVDDLIEAIGDPDDVTLESLAAITAAEDAYKALTDDQKALVTKADDLTAAREKYDELAAAADKAEKDQAAAKGVSDAIDTLGEVTLDDEAKVEAARAAYNALTDDQKALIQNEDVLTAAEAKIAQLKADTPAAEAVDKAIAAIGEVTKYKESEIEAAREAYDALSDSQKALVTKLDVLEAAEERLEELKNAASDPENTIRVSFRLIGSTLATEDVDLSQGEEGYYGAEYQNWVKTKTYTMSSDSSVYDLFVKATGDAGIESKGASSGYVSSIKAPAALGGYWLSEMTNGQYSGWMYTMDGKHANAIKDQMLKDGAEVIFHYVNDYRYEVEDWFDEPQYPSLATDDTFYNRWLEAEDVRPGSQSGGSTPAQPGEETPGEEPGTEPGGQSAADRFIDVSETDWFAGAVDYAVEHNIMAGTGEKTFSPNRTLSRGMLATMLYSLEGAPEMDGKTKYTDVKPTDWFAKGVEWVTENGIAAGYGEKFGPDDDITREQMVVMLYGYAKMKGYDIVAGADLSGYSDAGEISDWAKEAMAWAKAAGLVTGRSADTLAPKGTATRAEAATIMMNFMKSVAKVEEKTEEAGE